MQRIPFLAPAIPTAPTATGSTSPTSTVAATRPTVRHRITTNLQTASMQLYAIVETVPGALPATTPSAGGSPLVRVRR